MQKCFSRGQNGSNQTHGSHSHTGDTHPPTSKSWQLHPQTAEMARTRLDSSILSPFLSEPDFDHPDAMPPPEDAYLVPYSDEYFVYFGIFYSNILQYFSIAFKLIYKRAVEFCFDGYLKSSS